MFSIRELISNIFCDNELILVILHRIPMRTINHDTLVQDLGLSHDSATRLNRFCIVICPVLAAVGQQTPFESGLPPKDDKTIIIAFGTSNRCQALLCHTKERVSTCRGTNCIKSNVKRSIGTILESNWEGQSRSQFSVQLRFRGPCTYSPKRQQIRKELNVNVRFSDG